MTEGMLQQEIVEMSFKTVHLLLNFRKGNGMFRTMLEKMMKPDLRTCR